MRTTADDVRAILDNSSLTDLQIEAYITTANLFVTNHLGSTTLDSDTLADIERWITAHTIVMTRERQAKKEEAGTAKIEYVGTFREGLRQTSYGQTAIMLDTTGTLDTLVDGKQNIKIIAL